MISGFIFEQAPFASAHADHRRSRHGAIAEAWSDDGGSSWSRLRPTDLPNPDGANDALVLDDCRGLLA
jgi:BNR repeat protein